MNSQGEKGKGKMLTGTVVSTKMQKTVVVEVRRMHRHPLYRKAIRRTRKFSAHNEDLSLAVGDRVSICETKPMSRTKHFIVVEKLSR